MEQINQSRQLENDLLAQPHLFASDSQREYNSLHNAVVNQIRPRDAVEMMWTADLFDGEFEAQRLRRFKASIVNSNRPQAIIDLLKRLPLGAAEYYQDSVGDLHSWGEQYFTNKVIRTRVNKMLFKYGLGERDIDVEAFRLSMSELAWIDARLMELATRRDKMLRNIDDYRAGLATRTSEFVEIESGH